MNRARDNMNHEINIKATAPKTFKKHDQYLSDVVLIEINMYTIQNCLMNIAVCIPLCIMLRLDYFNF